MSWSNSVPASFSSGPRKQIKKVTGKLVARPLPPLHSCSVPGPNGGKWAIMHKQHFGYDTPRGEGGKERNWNTFYCVEEFDWRSRSTTRHCPECDNIKEKKDLLEATKKAMASEGRSGDEIKRAVEPLANWLQKHNLDAKWYINVKSSEGEYFTLKIGSKLKKKLDALIKELRVPTQPGRQSIDAFDPGEGVWLEFTKSGEGFNSDYDVVIARETIMVDINGVKTPVETIRKAPLAADEKEKAEATCYDLADIGIQRISVEQVQALVKSDGSPESIDAILNNGTPVEGVTGWNSKPTAPVTPKLEPVPVVQAPVATQVDVAALERQLAEAKAKAAELAKAAEIAQAPVPKSEILTKPEPGPKPATLPPPPNYASMSLEDLAKQFGPK